MSELPVTVAEAVVTISGIACLAVALLGIERLSFGRVWMPAAPAILARGAFGALGIALMANTIVLQRMVYFGYLSSDVNATPRPTPTMSPSITLLSPPPYSVQRVFFATDRTLASKNPLSFSRESNDNLLYGYSDVSIPPTHKYGNVERPLSIPVLDIELRAENRAKDMTIVAVHLERLSDFQRALKDAARRSRRHEGLVFIHGFNVTWHAAVLSTAQLAYDLQIDGPSIAYDWTSAGSIDPFAYRRDQQNAEATADNLASFLEMVSTKSGVTKLHVVAHSMGNYALALALEHVASQRRRIRNIQDIAMAAPDIDSRVFTRRYAALFRTNAGRINIYASSQDTALQISQLVNGYHRLGDARNITIVPGFDVIDATAVYTDFLGHGYYAGSLALMTDLNGFFSGRAMPRFPLQKKALRGATYYAFPPYASP